MDRQLQRQIDELTNDPEVMLAHLENTVNNLKAERQSLEGRLKPLEAEVVSIREEMAICDARLEMRRLSSEVYRVRIRQLQKRLEDVEHRKKGTDPLLVSELKEKDADIEYYRSMLWSFRDALKRYEGEGKERLITEGIKALANQIITGTTYDHAKVLAKGLLPNASNASAKGCFIVYPDRTELKGVVNIANSNIAPGCRSSRCRQSR